MTNYSQNRIEFWIDLWEDLIGNFLKKSYGLSLYSPHILVEDIISEIEENSFKSIENKKYFYSKLDFYFKNDEIINAEFYSSFKILRRTFNSENHSYILETSKQINKKFQKGLYFDSSIEILIRELKKDEQITIEFIDVLNYISQNLIVEFIKKGYNLEDVKKFPSNIFDNYKIQKIEGEDFLRTNYPHDINSKDFYDDKHIFKRENFNTQIINFLSTLNLEDRIKTLSKYFYKTEKKANYIFVVEGLKGSINIEVAGVEFYSLDKKKYIIKGNNQEQEDLQFNENEKFIQASVEVGYLLPKSSLRKAVTKLENALDIICCYYKTDTPLEINTSNYVIVQDGNYIFSSWSQNNRDIFVKHNNSLDLNNLEKHLIEVNENSFLWDEKENQQKSKILNAIHWFSKAEQSVKQEDKMLNYWIAIENLFNLEYDIINSNNKSKIHLIQDIVSSMQIFKFIYDYGWELYHHYVNKVRNDFGKKSKIPDDLILKANLSTEIGEKIYLVKFIESLSEIKKHETDLFIIQKIDNLIKFYNDKSILKNIINQQIELIEQDILMIYRFRNLIVHNAHFDNTLLPYFVWKIRTYSGNLIRNIISGYKDSENTLPTLFIGIHLKKEQFLSDMEKGKVNLFED